MLLKTKQKFISISRFFKFMKKKKEYKFDIKEILLRKDDNDKLKIIVDHLNKDNLEFQNFIFKTKEFKKLYENQSFLDSLRLPMALKVGNIGLLIRNI